jgi:urocanate hydratase
MATATRTIRAPRGTSLACNGSQQEAALRMPFGTPNRGGAERPDGVIVHGRSEKTAIRWPTATGAMGGRRLVARTTNDTATLVIGVDSGAGPPIAVVSPAREAEAVTAGRRGLRLPMREERAC